MLNPRSWIKTTFGHECGYSGCQRTLRLGVAQKCGVSADALKKEAERLKTDDQARAKA